MRKKVFFPQIIGGGGHGLFWPGVVLHKIQDFQESCLGPVLLSRQDQDKTAILKIKTRQD